MSEKDLTLVHLINLQPKALVRSFMCQTLVEFSVITVCVCVLVCVCTESLCAYAVCIQHMCVCLCVCVCMLVCQVIGVST